MKAEFGSSQVPVSFSRDARFRRVVGFGCGTSIPDSPIIHINRVAYHLCGLRMIEIEPGTWKPDRSGGSPLYRSLGSGAWSRHPATPTATRKLLEWAEQTACRLGETHTGRFDRPDAIDVPDYDTIASDLARSLLLVSEYVDAAERTRDPATRFRPTNADEPTEIRWPRPRFGIADSEPIMGAQPAPVVAVAVAPTGEPIAYLANPRTSRPWDTRRPAVVPVSVAESP